jgi:hypothetical protein
MSMVVIGGDHLGGITNKLKELGVTELFHISGRKKLDFKKVPLNNQPACILVLTDYINHNMMIRIKNEAKNLSIPLIFARRSWSTIEQKMKESGWMAAASDAAAR